MQTPPTAAPGKSIRSHKIQFPNNAPAKRIFVRNPASRTRRTRQSNTKENFERESSKISRAICTHTPREPGDGKPEMEQIVGHATPGRLGDDFWARFPLLTSVHRSMLTTLRPTLCGRDGVEVRVNKERRKAQKKLLTNRFSDWE